MHLLFIRNTTPHYTRSPLVILSCDLGSQAENLDAEEPAFSETASASISLTVRAQFSPKTLLFKRDFFLQIGLKSTKSFSFCLLKSVNRPMQTVRCTHLASEFQFENRRLEDTCKGADGGLVSYSRTTSAQRSLALQSYQATLLHEIRYRLAIWTALPVE